MNESAEHHGFSFTRMATFASRTAGRPSAFAIAVGALVIWGLTGRFFHYSDTWQLVINTATSLITFLMVFLIQHTQNRDTQAIQVKLDELIRAMGGAHNALLDLEDLGDEELSEIRENYARLAKTAREGLAKGLEDTRVIEITATPRTAARKNKKP